MRIIPSSSRDWLQMVLAMFGIVLAATDHVALAIIPLWIAVALWLSGWIAFRIVVGFVCAAVSAAIVGTITGHQIDRDRTSAFMDGEREHANGEVLEDAVTSMHYPCTGVTRVYHRGKSADADFWSITCLNGPSYTIERKNDGHFSVLKCTLAAVASIDCFSPLK